MGCDIHGYIEYKDEYRWRGLFGQLWLPRHYKLFSALAGVRAADESEVLFVDRGVPSDTDKYFLDDLRRSAEHSFSHLNTDEVEKAVVHADCASTEWAAIVAAMRALDSAGTPARIVFGFDN